MRAWPAAQPNAPSRGNSGLRFIILVFTAIDIGTLIYMSARHGFPGLSWRHAWDLFALIAEYAKTIGTIPPRKIERPAAARSEARL